jgi:hypothetical protein
MVANDRRGSGASGHFGGNFGGNSKWRIGVTPTERDSSLACAKTTGLLAPASLSTALIRFRMPNSNWHIASLVSSGELAIEGSCGRYRPTPVGNVPTISVRKPPFRTSARLLPRCERHKTMRSPRCTAGIYGFPLLCLLSLPSRALHRTLLET